MEKQNEAIHNNERRDEEGGEREREMLCNYIT